MRTQPFRLRGFTLIELLIVVAIIAILAAIAVPNFLEAQTRSKVSRSKSDLRTLAGAMQANLVDRGPGALLVDFWDDDDIQARIRGEELFGIEILRNNRGGAGGVMIPLTTPIAFITSIPVDAFTDQGYDDDLSDLIGNDLAPPFTYLYVDNDPKILGPDFDVPLRIRDNDWLFLGAGPDRGLERSTPNLLLYDPTNGTLSRGNIVYHSRTIFELYE